MKAFRQTILELSANDKLDKLGHKPLSGSRLKQLAKSYITFEDIDLDQWQGYPPPSNSSQVTKNEIHNLISLGQNRDKWERDMVMHDKTIMQAFKEYLDEHGLEVDLDRIKKIKNESHPILLSLKRYYNRPRPQVLAKKIGLDLSFFPLKTAETPSYPSGHAAQGRLVAKLIADEVPLEHRRNILDIGERVGYSRQVAGAHYASDTEFGHRLGDELYRLATTRQEPDLKLEDVLSELEVANKAALAKYIGGLKTGKMRASTVVKYTDSGETSTVGKEMPDAATDDDEDEKDKEEPKGKKEIKAKALEKNELDNDQKETADLRDKGIAGAGGAAASQGESIYCNACDTLGYEKFNNTHADKIGKEVTGLKDRKPKYPSADEKRTLTSIGFDDPNSPEAKQYIASREVFANKELERIKALPKPNVYTKGSGFGGPSPKADKDYKDWMHAAYDGALATKQRLKESRMDASKPTKTIQSTRAVDDKVEADLKHKIETSKGEDKKHYENELKHFGKNREYHDTYVVGEDKEGRTFIVSVSNKKGSDMKDPQNNTTPAKRLTEMRKEYGEKTAKTVHDANVAAVKKVTTVRESTMKDGSEIEIDDDYAAVAEAASPKRVTKIKVAGTKRGRVKGGKRKGLPSPANEFGCWLDDDPRISEDKWNKMSTAKQLKLTQDFTADSDWHTENGTEAVYDPYGKIHIKVGEVSTGGHRKLKSIRAALAKKGIDPSKHDSVAAAGDIKKNEQNAVNEAHQGVINEIGNADEGLGKDGKNGPHTQAYVSSVMDAMHIGTYINTTEEDDDKMIIQMGSNAVKASHYRQVLADATGFEGDISTPEGKKALEKHIKENAKLEMDEEGKYTGAIVITGKDGKTKTKLFEDTWRTAGDSQKVASSFGGDTIEGLTEASRGDKARLQKNQVEKGRLLGFNEWNS